MTDQISEKDKCTSLFRKYLFRLSLELFITFILVVGLCVTGVSPDMLLLISIFYFVNIVTNVITAVRSALRNLACMSNVIYAAGMCFFLLCDINVGIFNMSGFIEIPEKLYQILYGVSSILMWTFYAPSQVLIALGTSIICKNRQKD